MSRRQRATVAVEWSPRGVAVIDTASRQERRYDDLREASGLAGQTAVVGISRRALFVRTTRVPDADPATVRQVLLMRAADLFPVAPGEIALDFLPLGDVNAEGRLALVVAIPAGDLRRIRLEAKDAGLRVERVVPAALGSALVAKSLGRPDCALVSRETGGLGIDVIGNYELRHSRTVPNGALVDAEVCRTFSVAGLPCGDTVTAPGVTIDDSVAQATTTPLEALATHWPDDWRLNLELPEEVAARTKAEGRGRMRSAAFLALAAGALLAFVAQEYSDQVKKADEKVRREQGKLRPLKSIQDKAEKDAAAQAAYQRTLQKAFRPAQRLGDVVALMSNRLPEGTWLAGVTVERGKPILVRGTALNGAAVTNFVTRLTSEPRLRDVRLVFANNAVIEDKPVVQFSVTAFPVGNIPINEPTTKKKGAKK